MFFEDGAFLFLSPVSENIQTCSIEAEERVQHELKKTCGFLLINVESHLSSNNVLSARI